MLRLPPGGTLSLQCTISRLNLPPKNLHWKHEKQILTSQTRPGVSLEFEKLSGESHTKLVIVDLALEVKFNYMYIGIAMGMRTRVIQTVIESIQLLKYKKFMTHRVQ